MENVSFMHFLMVVRFCWKNSKILISTSERHQSEIEFCMQAEKIVNHDIEWYYSMGFMHFPEMYFNVLLAFLLMEWSTEALHNFSG